jgi:hypothetical protein
MKILQTPFSNAHKSAMFFEGSIAYSRGYDLKTYQDGEIVFNKEIYVGKEIIELGKTGSINDNDIDLEERVDILVDKFFTITVDDVVVDDTLMFNDYDEAIEEFKDFLDDNK